MGRVVVSSAGDPGSGSLRRQQLQNPISDDLPSRTSRNIQRTKSTSTKWMYSPWAQGAMLLVVLLGLVGGYFGRPLLHWLDTRRRDSHTSGWGFQIEPRLAPQQEVVFPTSGDDCAGALDISKVALMFLAQHGMLHMDMWATWFHAIAGYVPTEALQKGKSCSGGANQADLVVSLCGSNHADTIIRQQHLYSVYVHTYGHGKAVMQGTPFEGTEVLDRQPLDAQSAVDVWQGGVFVRAAKLLLQAAYQEPSNQYFVLLSDDSVPLYPAAAVYRQLLSERYSRINACAFEGRDEHKFSKLMARPWFTRSQWRKSSRWFGLHRTLVSKLVKDRRMEKLFLDTCSAVKQSYSGDDVPEVCQYHNHFFPSLIAAEQLDNATDCHGELVFAEITPDGRRDVRQFVREDVQVELLLHMRGDMAGCKAKQAIQQAEKTFTDLHNDDLQDVCRKQPNRYKPSVPGHCSLFARRFVAEASDALMTALGDCSSGMDVLRGPRKCEIGQPVLTNTAQRKGSLFQRLFSRHNQHSALGTINM